MGARPRLILASASPRRLSLLESVGVRPDAVLPSDVDETERPGELARDYVLRVARDKAQVAAARETGAVILAADTAVAVGRRILPKTETEDQARDCLDLLSGRAHRVFTGVVVAGPTGAVSERVVETRVKVRRLDEAAIGDYLASGEWRGKAGGYAIQGRFAAHVIAIVGSHPNVIGLPLYETMNLLAGAGWRAA